MYECWFVQVMEVCTSVKAVGDEKEKRNCVCLFSVWEGCNSPKLHSLPIFGGWTMVLHGWPCQAHVAANQLRVLFGVASRRLMSGGSRQGGGGSGSVADSCFPYKNKKFITQQILRSDTESLCDLVKARGAEFNHVNVVAALRKALEAPRHRVPRDIMGILEESAFKNMLNFEPRNVANVLHIMAKKRYNPQERLYHAIEQRAEAISGEFNSQAVANTLWAYATMGRKPGERLMGLLEGRTD